ncbi:DUF4352 domain-containing protein [Streptomyces fuscigenes]|uniref:DUF4352 domain-containing protein n=1 Tax=Streptomyces fuscigenes TaxID=1528880 RepID=UPI001F2CF7BF|nr:DUF4352 domain-containing protein [Streptomyces fuscigenes]MCF3963346.1 DUF4352 domain-containing protein [Streptomyces fuscigenes]
MSQYTQGPQGPAGPQGAGGQDPWGASGARPQQAAAPHGPGGPLPEGPAAPGSHHAPRARNGLGIAALILGLVGALSGLVPVLFWLAGVLGLIGLILGLAGQGRAKRGEATNKGVARIGALLGLVAMIVAVIGAVITFRAVGDAVDQIDKAAAGSSASAKPHAGSGADADKTGKTDKGDKADSGVGSKDKPLSAGDTAVYDDDLNVTIGAAQPYSPDDFAVGHKPGNHAYKVTITIENKGKKAYDATLTTVAARAGADGREATEIFDNTVGEGFTGQVLPGRKATAVFAFDAPGAARSLTVQFSPGLSYNETQWDLSF